MNAGFSSLASLKAQLLAASLRSRSDWDAQILALGQGVASLFDGVLNRKLARVVGDTFEQRGGKKMVLLPRYPIESIASVETRIGMNDAWEAQDVVDWYSAESGLVNFPIVLGTPRWRVRVTYTGGYWWNTNETSTDSLPSGATALPEAILTAWHLQCEALWRAKDKLGTQIAKEPEAAGRALSTGDLLPIVQTMLKDHIRYGLN